MRSLIFFIALAMCSNLEAQNNFANNKQQKYLSSTDKINIVTSNEDSPLAHPAKKEFPYDFELAAKDPNYNTEASNQTESASEIIYASTTLTNSEDFMLTRTAKKDFPYDFEIAAKALQPVVETNFEKDYFFPTWQPTIGEIRSMVSSNFFKSDESRVASNRIKNKTCYRIFLSY